MTHVCCILNLRQTGPTPYTQPKIQNRAWRKKDRREVQEEESEFKQILDTYMQLYHDLLHEHVGPFDKFWSAWWKTMEYSLPRSKSQLTSPVNELHETCAEAVSKENADIGPHAQFRDIYRSIVERCKRQSGEVVELINSKLAPGDDHDSESDGAYSSD
jgi:hypothetical protein